MQVQVHHVHAEIPRPGLAHQGVHVGAVHVEQGALGVENVGDLVDLALEHADGAGVGQHQRRRVVGDDLFQLRHIDHAQRIGAEVLHLVAADGGRGRVGSVRRVGDDDLAPRISLGLVVSAHQQDAGELPMRARRRLQRDRVHAGDVEQAGLQQANDFERSLGERLRLVRMGLGNALQAGDEFVDPRVVLHGAAAQRVHAQIDGVVPGGEAGEMADDFDFAQLRHQAQIRARGFAQQGLQGPPRARRAAASCKPFCPAKTFQTPGPRSGSGASALCGERPRTAWARDPEWWLPWTVCLSSPGQGLFGFMLQQRGRVVDLLPGVELGGAP